MGRIQGEGEVYICSIEERGRTIIIASIRSKTAKLLF